MLKNITIITDCRDDNARLRQEIRYKALFPDATTNFCGVETELEAEGNLIDAIDAYKGMPGIIAINVAPRGNKDKYPNGIPFCFHKYEEVLIVGTPNCFPLAKKLGLFDKTNKVEVKDVCAKFLSEKETDHISGSQFRSFEFLPYLAKWIGQEFPFETIDIDDFGDDNFVWRVDNFGNCKTTLTEADRANNDIRYFDHLADVPKDGEQALIKGSSGYKDTRFLEIVIQNESASQKLNLNVGSRI